MYFCLDCGELFEKPLQYIEDHRNCKEYISCCPNCNGDYVKTYRCDKCGEWIDNDKYYKIGKKKYCEECCAEMNLGG